MEESIEMSLISLCEGAAGQLFEREMQKVANNIDNPNTDPKTVREIIIKISIKPSETRESAEVSIGAVSKLAPMKSISTLAFLSHDNTGRMVAVENTQRNGAFNFSQPEGVTPINLKKEAK